MLILYHIKMLIVILFGDLDIVYYIFYFIILNFPGFIMNLNFILME